MDYNTFTKYQLEKELKRLNDEIWNLQKQPFTTDKVEELNKETDKIITLLYGENFSGVGKKFY